MTTYIWGVLKPRYMQIFLGNPNLKQQYRQTNGFQFKINIDENKVGIHELEQLVFYEIYKLPTE